MAGGDSRSLPNAKPAVPLAMTPAPGPPPCPPARSSALLRPPRHTGGCSQPRGEQPELWLGTHGRGSPPSPLSPLSPPLQPSRSLARGQREEAAARGQVMDGLSKDEGPRLVASPWQGASRSIFMAAILYTPDAVTSRRVQAQQPSAADKSPCPM